MNGLDFSVQNRVNGLNSGYVSKPSELQHADNSPRATEKKRTFDKSYCQTVQAYFAPNFIKAGEKPCSVTEYTAKLIAAGLKEGKDFETGGFDSEDNFGFYVLLKDSAGREKKKTFWINGLEAENYKGYEKYSYNQLDKSYKKTVAYSSDNKMKYSSEYTSAIPQENFTSEGLRFSTNPKTYAEMLKSKGKTPVLSKSVSGSKKAYKADEYEENIRKNRVVWVFDNDKRSVVKKLIYDSDGINIERSFSFMPDGSTIITRYANE